MALPSYGTIVGHPDYQNLPEERKVKLAQDYWQKAGNPEMANDALRVIQTPNADLAPVQARVQRELSDISRLRLASYEPEAAGQEEKLSAAILQREDNLNKLNSITTDEGSKILGSVIGLGQKTDKFTSGTFQPGDYLGMSSVEDRNKQYEETRNTAAENLGLTADEIDDVVKHNLQGQKEVVSRDALGSVHYKNEIFTKTNDEIEKEIRNSNLPESVKEKEIANFGTKLDGFKGQIIDKVKKNYPEYAAHIGLDGKDDFKKISDSLIQNVLENEATSVTNAFRKTGISVFDALNKLPGSREDRSNLFASVSDKARNSLKIDEAQLALSQEFNKDKLEFLGATGGTVGQGAYSVLESAALAYATGGLVPSIAGTGRVISGANSALRVAPTAATFGVRQGFDTYDQAKAAGLSDEEAKKLAITSGVIETGLTLTFSALGLGGSESAAANIGRDTIRRSVSDTLKAIPKSVLGEELEENSINIVNQALVELKTNPNMTVDDFKQSIYDTTIATLLPASAVSLAVNIPTFKQTTPQLEQSADSIYTEEELSQIKDEGGTQPTSSEDLVAERDRITQEASGLIPGSERRVALEERAAEIDGEISANGDITETQPDLVVNETPVSAQQEDLSNTDESQTTPEAVTEEALEANGGLESEQLQGAPGTVVSDEVQVDQTNNISNENQLSNPPETPATGVGTTETIPDGSAQATQEVAPTTNSEQISNEIVVPEVSDVQKSVDIVIPISETPPISNRQPQPLPPEEEKIVRATNASVSRDLNKYNLPPIVKDAKQALGGIWDNAVAQVQRDPQVANRLISELAGVKTDESGEFTRGRPRSVTANEQAVILYEYARRRINQEKTRAQLNSAKDPVIAQGLQDQLQIQIAEFKQAAIANKIAGSELGRALRLRQIGIDDESFDLVSMQNRYQSEVNNGQQLSSDQETLIKNLNSKLEKAEADHVVALQEQETRIRKEYEQQTLDRAEKDVRNEKQKEKQQSKKQSLDQQIKDAKKRLADRQKEQEGRAFSGSPYSEKDVVDVAIIASAYLRKGVITIQEFTRNLVSEFGNGIEPFAQQVFDESKRFLAASGLTKTPAELLAEIDPSKAPNKQTVYNLLKAHIREGMKGRAALNQVHKDLQSKWKNVSFDEVSDLVTSYNRTINPTLNEMRQELSDARKIAGLLNRIRDLENGVKRTPKSKAAVNSEIQNLRDQVKLLVKETKASIPADPVVSAKNRLRKEITALENAVKNNELIQKPQRNAQTDAELESLREQAKAARADYNEAFPEHGPEFNAKSRRIVELQKAIENNKLIPEKNKSQKQKNDHNEMLNEMERLYKEAFPTHGPSLNAKQRQILELQEAISKNRMLPEKQKNAKKINDDSKRLSELRKEYNEQFKEQGTQLTPNQEIDRAVEALDKQIDREGKAIAKDLNQFSWFSPEISERRRILDQKREARNDLRWRENAEKSAREAIAKAEEIIRTGKLPEVKRGSQRSPSQNLQVLWDQRNALQDVVTAMRRNASADQREISSIEKSIKEYERRIADKDFSSRPPRKTTDPDVIRLREARKAIAKTYSDLKNANSYEDRVVSALDKRTATIQQRIRDGDFSKNEVIPKEETTRIQEARLRAAQAKQEWDKLFFEHNLSQQTKVQKAMRILVEPVNLSRTIITSLDLPPIFRQGMGVTLTRPSIAFKNFPKAFASGLSEKKSLLAEEAVRDHPQYHLAKAAKLSITESGPYASLSQQEEEFRGRWAKKIPGVSVVANFSERNYVSFLNGIRMDLFSTLVQSMSVTGDVSLAEAKLIANYVNNVTGRGSWNAVEGSMSALSAVLFSPRYWISRINTVLGVFPAVFDVATGFKFREADVVRARKAIAKEYARALIGYGTIYGSLIMAAQGYDDEDDKFSIEFDPRSSDFGKIKIGKGRFDPLAGMASNIVFASRFFTASSKSIKSGKITEKEGSAFMGMVGSFVRGKAAPLPGAVINYLAKEDVVGNKTSLRSEVSGLFLPMSPADIYEQFSEFGPMGGTGSAMLTLMGVGTQVHDDGLTPRQKIAVFLGDDPSVFSKKKPKSNTRFMIPRIPKM